MGLYFLLVVVVIVKNVSNISETVENALNVAKLDLTVTDVPQTKTGLFSHFQNSLYPSF